MITDIDEIKWVKDPFNRKKAVAMQPHGGHVVFNNSVSQTKKVKDRVSYDKLKKKSWWHSPKNGLKKDEYIDYEYYETSFAKISEED